MDALVYLTGIGLIFILGILTTIIAKKLKISNLLLLLITGLIIGNTKLSSLDYFQPEGTFLVGLAIFTLAIIVFDGSSRFSLREFDALSVKATEVSLLFMAFNMILTTIIINQFYYGFTGQGILLGAILGIVLSGTDPGSTFILLGDRPHKVLQFLKIESIINTPIIVLLPFLLLDMINSLKEGMNLFNTAIGFVTPFLQQIVVGIGAGMLIGLIIFKAMKKYYSENLSPIAIIGAILITYVISENLGGNGVLAVAVVGLMFGNSYVKEKGTLQEFSSLLSYALQILVFVLIGTIMKLKFDPYFWLTSLLILIGIMISRFLAIRISTNHDYSWKERIFMTLNMPKGIALAVVALTLAVTTQGLELLVNFMIIITLFTLIISSITDRFGKYFLKFEIEQKK